MNNIDRPLPRARKQNLITKEVAGELVIYDQASDRVHCLNSTAAFVWTHCDGETSLATMAGMLEAEIKSPVEQDVILYALKQLHKSKLLDDTFDVIATKPVLSRRAIMRLGLATALTIPLVTSIVSPTAAQAASCLPPGAACVADADCCSNSCVDNGRGGFECA